MKEKFQVEIALPSGNKLIATLYDEKDSNFLVEKLKKSGVRVQLFQIEATLIEHAAKGDNLP